MILLDKILSAFTFPVGLVAAGLVLAIVALGLGARRTGTVMVIVLTLLLWVAAVPATARILLASLETQSVAQRVEDLPISDVVIVLGGGVRPANGANPYADLGEGADRVIHAFRIFKAGKARTILLSGGNVFGDEESSSEAAAMAELLVLLGVDRAHLLLEETSRSTFENAQESAGIWRRDNFTSGLLVTSASHMPRALATFQKMGLNVVAAQTDVLHGGFDEPFPLSLLPNSASLDRTTRAIKEWIGLLVYRWRGRA